MPKKNKSKDKPMPTVDELVSTIKRSSLPTVVLEGDGDVIALRGMEDEYYDLGLSVMPAGGRNNVLQIFDRRHEFKSKNVAFIVDQDTWVMDAVPEKYRDARLICTSGYSIENDIYVDGELEKLMSAGERDTFHEELGIFLTWYALALNRCNTTGGEEYKTHPNAICDNASEREKKMTLHSDEAYPEQMRQRLLDDYRRLLRGKSLMALLIRQLSYKGRAVHHHHLQLIEHVGSKRGPLIERLYQNVAAAISPRVIAKVA